MKLYHFSDTHGLHGWLEYPQDIDIAIFSGDESNSRDPYTNEQECLNFLEWYSTAFKAKHKVFVAGNHSTAIAKGLITRKQIEKKGIIYLENSSCEIEGAKIWGSPITPTFGDWSFMRSRDKLNKLWQEIPEDTDIVVVHGPPKTILDSSYDRNNVLEFCGCSALLKRMLSIQPRFMMFGHIHNNKEIINAGTKTLVNCKTIFSNGSCVTDGRFSYGLSSHGNTFIA
jgi:Icc-related predicted phosphoesterase